MTIRYPIPLYAQHVQWKTIQRRIILIFLNRVLCFVWYYNSITANILTFGECVSGKPNWKHLMSSCLLYILFLFSEFKTRPRLYLKSCLCLSCVRILFIYYFSQLKRLLFNQDYKKHLWTSENLIPVPKTSLE